MTFRSSFAFALDTEIHFGIGSRRLLGKSLVALGERFLLVTGRSFDLRPYSAEMIASIADQGVVVGGRVLVSGEPDDLSIRAAAEEIERVGADAVVAIGGGSVIDAAKAAAIVARGADLSALLDGQPVLHGDGLPVLAMPTTAGTGSEVSRAAIISDRMSGRKRGVRGPGVAPKIAIVDPELVVSSNPTVTAEAGFDAMAHALETGVSRAASPLNLLLAGEAMRLVYRAIPRSLEEPTDLRARSDASYAALLMGINLATASTCLPHRLQYPVGARTRTSHPRGVAVLMPAWLERTRQIAPERLGALGGLPEAGDASSTGDGAANLVAAIGRWMDRIGMRIRLRDLGVREPDIQELVTMVEGNLQNDPGPVEQADLERLYRESW